MRSAVGSTILPAGSGQSATGVRHRADRSRRCARRSPSPDRHRARRHPPACSNRIWARGGNEGCGAPRSASWSTWRARRVVGARGRGSVRSSSVTALCVAFGRRRGTLNSATHIAPCMFQCHGPKPPCSSASCKVPRRIAYLGAARSALLDWKLRKLELTAGYPSLRGGKTKGSAADYSNKSVRDSERETIGNAEEVYHRFVATPKQQSPKGRSGAAHEVRRS